MGGGIWEQKNLGGVKVGGDSCGRQATFRMCRRLRFLQRIDDFVDGKSRLCLGRRPWNSVPGVYIFDPLMCTLVFARSFSSLKALWRSHLLVLFGAAWALACEVVHIFLARGELVFCILLERFRGGLCVLFLEFLMCFCFDYPWIQGCFCF